MFLYSSNRKPASAFTKGKNSAFASNAPPSTSAKILNGLKKVCSMELEATLAPTTPPNDEIKGVALIVELKNAENFSMTEKLSDRGSMSVTSVILNKFIGKAGGGVIGLGGSSPGGPKTKGSPPISTFIPNVSIVRKTINTANANAFLIIKKHPLKRWKKATLKDKVVP